MNRPTEILGLIIHLLKTLISRKFIPIWIRIILAALVGILLAIQVVCGGIF